MRLLTYVNITYRSITGDLS